MTRSTKPEFSITFWGTRGTLPAPGPQFQRAGGNTNCTEVKCGDHTIIFDAGTGIRELGSKICGNCVDGKIDLFLTHAHYDHMEGIPFFAPFFSDGFKIRVWCGKLDGSSSTQETVEQLMRTPYFPVGPDVFTADVEYLRIDERVVFDLTPDIKISTIPLNHPGGATAYRIDYDGRSFAYVTDTESIPGEIDESIVELIRDVDLFIYDSSLTDEEFPDFIGYGHSTFEEGVRLCKAANAGAYLAYHHMPFRVDDELDQIEAEIKKTLPKSGIAREGDVIEL
ncbi:MAG: MBL fold metallo-hydrolase [Rhizobiaceae bacterium]|nr:MBL fold metallo-hydrolase [Rhizobiaceae bacterium]